MTNSISYLVGTSISLRVTFTTKVCSILNESLLFWLTISYQRLVLMTDSISFLVGTSISLRVTLTTKVARLAELV